MLRVSVKFHRGNQFFLTVSRSIGIILALIYDIVHLFNSHPGSLPDENALLHVPMGTKKKISAKETPKEIHRTPLINKSLYPLHLRRGAVSPASFSLKSASTASSLNALPRGYNELYNALNSKGPIILLSDQASVQSLCSINSRMTCSCSSLRTAGSDGLANTDGNRTRLGSDGSLVYSPTEKVDGTQVTLSVPVECHRKRKDSSESRTGTKGTENSHSLPATKKGKRENDATDYSNDRNETEFKPVEFVTLPHEAEAGNRGKRDGKLVNSQVDHGENASHGHSRKNENIVADNQNVNQSQHYQETMSENTPNEDNSPSEFTIPQANTPFEKGDDFKLPVKPVPVMGRAVSAYSIMEYNIGKNMSPRNGENQAVHSNSKVFDCKSENGPKRRRHSAFTTCHDNNASLVNRRRGRLSTGCMKEHVTECEPLINGSEVQAHPCEELDGDKEEEDIFIFQSDQNFQSGKRLRKIGTSDSPPGFIQEKHPSWNSNTNTEGNHGDEDLNDETGIQPCSESLNNDSACSKLPSIKIQHDNSSEHVRTSRV